MAGILSKDRLIFDQADMSESDQVGAHLLAGSDGDKLTSTNIGGKEALDVNLVGGSDSGIFAEDTAHSSGDKGQFVLAVRKDTQGTLVSDDGDYAPLQVDDQGRLRVLTDVDLIGDLIADDDADTENPLKVGSHAIDQASVLGTVSAAGDKANVISDLYRRVFINDAPNVGVNSQVLSVGATEVALPTALAGRTRLMIQNTSSNDVYLGPTGLSVSSGLRIAKGATLSLEAGQALPLFMIAAGAGNSVRIFELA